MFVSQQAVFTDRNCIVDYAGGCWAPVSVHFGHREITTKIAAFAEFSVPVHRSRFDIEVLKVRCRKCPCCTYAKSCEWAERAIREWKSASVSLMGTLTFSEEWFERKWREQQLDDMNALSRQERDADAIMRGLDAVPEFDERARAQELRWLGRELTLFLMRLRKSGLSLRYMATTEFGRKKGRPHFHFVMHFANEKDVEKLQKKISDEWAHVGFSSAKLIYSEDGCRYAAKYIGKSGEIDGRAVTGGIRVRASQRYGALPSDDPSFSLGKKPNSEGTSPVSVTTRSGPLFSPKAGAKRLTARSAAAPAGLGSRRTLTGPVLTGHRDTRAGEHVRPRERWSDDTSDSLAWSGERGHSVRDGPVPPRRGSVERDRGALDARKGRCRSNSRTQDREPTRH